jgi:hypothetical protein
MSSARSLLLAGTGGDWKVPGSPPGQTICFPGMLGQVRLKVSPVKLDVSEYLQSEAATKVWAVWDQVSAPGLDITFKHGCFLL